MKKIITVLLVFVLALSCTACSWHQGSPEMQETELMKFVNKYYGEAEIVEKEVALLDTATIFMLKDKQDGFEYPITAMEVYMSDLGFTTTDSTGDEKTLIFDGQFTMKYVSNLIQNKVKDDEFKAASDKYDKLIDVSVVTYERPIGNVFNVQVEETSFLMTELDEEAIHEMAALMTKYDERGILDYYIMPIYQAKEANGTYEIEYREDGSAVVLGYYDFFFDYIMKPEDFDGVGMLHDFLLDSNFKDLQIKAVNHDIHHDAVHVEDGFSFLPNVQEKGTFIIISVDGVDYEFYTMLGSKTYASETDEYGIHAGSFLDVMATERTGGADVMIAYYAAMYPGNYHNMALHFKPVEPVEGGVTE